MKVVVNWSLCDGNGNCAKAAPTLFVMREDDTMELLKKTISEEDRSAAETAVKACPKGALRLTE